MPNKSADFLCSDSTKLFLLYVNLVTCCLCMYALTHILIQIQPVHSFCFSPDNVSIVCDSQIPQDTENLYKYSSFLCKIVWVSITNNISACSLIVDCISSDADILETIAYSQNGTGYWHIPPYCFCNVLLYRTSLFLLVQPRWENLHLCFHCYFISNKTRIPVWCL